ncbi:MAG: TonB-dependent receptor [Xanthomonadales bacterium]|nr:TonB-dependent receptor [Xanthomonadales bacterium]
MTLRYNILVQGSPAMRVRPLATAIAALLATPIALPAWAQTHSERERELDTVVIQATPLRQVGDDAARPIEVLAGPALDDSRASTLGETVSRLPGVQSSYFGAGVGRPIIRGLEGPRVQVLSEGLSTQDVSTVSVDHAVTIEPFLADQIEVLKGPSTLLFGSGAIGGAVNVVDGRIHEQPLEGISGRAEIRGNTVADERAGMFRIDAGNGPWVFHADAWYRRTADYRIPGEAERHDDHDHEHGHDDDDHGHGHGGRLENSATRNRGGAVAVSRVGERGFLGIALSRFESRYGLPGHSHHHDDEHEHDLPVGLRAVHDDDDHDHEDVTLDMRQNRADLKGALNDPFAGHETLRVRVSRSDYTHTEFEGDEVGTVFDNKALEARVELVHAQIGGWRGAYGIQAGRRDFEAVGEEAFVPGSRGSDVGLFLVERREWDRFNLELGGRVERNRIRPDSDDHASVSFTGVSASAAAEWRFTESLHLRLGLDRAQRAPSAEELYSDGEHVATQAIELGDAELGKETANNIELGLHWHGERVDFRASVYRTRFDDFIFLADTGEEDDGLPIRQWSQADADFQGAEAELKVTVADNASGRHQVRLMADTVRGELRDGGNLPRISPGRWGAGYAWSMGSWRAGVDAMRYRAQDRVAEFETATEGYTLVGADLAWSFMAGGTELELFAQGRNLTDREARVHTSFLKDQAPLPGRSVGFGVRAFF